MVRESRLHRGRAALPRQVLVTVTGMGLVSSEMFQEPVMQEKGVTTADIQD
jgi:hypothetical protein